MTEGSEPRVVLGPEIDGAFEGRFAVDYATDTGDALIEHIESGAEVRWNGSEWVFNKDIDAPNSSVDSATLRELQTLEPATEPATPSGDEVNVWNDTNSLKAKFSDGTIVTLAEQ
jgi:hypothetical protein